MPGASRFPRNHRAPARPSRRVLVAIGLVWLCCVSILYYGLLAERYFDGIGF